MRWRDPGTKCIRTTAFTTAGTHQTRRHGEDHDHMLHKQASFATYLRAARPVGGGVRFRMDRAHLT